MISRKDVRKALKQANSTHSDAPQGFTPAAVLVPIVETESGIGLVFIKRRPDLAVHAGEYSFPGGHVEPDDTSPEDTALRETEEEIGHPRTRIEVLGRLSPCPTLTRFYIQPIVGWLDQPYSFKPQPEEVSEIVVLTAEELLNPQAWQPVQVKVDPSFAALVGRVEVHEVIVRNCRIWGATARILRKFFQRVFGIDPANPNK